MQIVFLGFTDKHHRPGSLRADKHSRILPLKSECTSSRNLSLIQSCIDVSARQSKNKNVSARFDFDVS